MQIDKNTVVTLNYILTDEQGNEIDRSSDGQFTYLHGSSNIIPGLENALTGKQAGDEVKVNVAPEEAYGQRDDSLQQQVSMEMFESAGDVKVGQQFHAQTPNGDPLVITVTAVDGDQVTIDANHPLAGVNLNFDVAVVDVREASDEEIEHGHVHGADGHEH
jgi:FKBP-type peptidyl-prolyl cis-trans isomerase SlyD